MSGISSTARSRPGRLVILLLLLALLGCLFVWVQVRQRHVAAERLRHASLEALQTIAQNDPDNSQVQYQIGNRWMLQGQLIPAHQAFVQAARLDPGDRASGLAAARAAGLLGRHAEAASLLQSFLQRYPDDTEAQKMLTALPKSDKTSDVQILNKADALLGQQVFDQAAEAYLAVLQEHPDSALALQGAGIALHTLGQKVPSFLYLYQAVERDPALVQSRFLLANIYQEAGFVDEAVSQYRAVVAATPENARAWAMIGVLLYQPASLAAAEDALRHAVRLSPEDAYYVLSMAEVQGQRKEEKGAEESYRRALSLAPKDPTYRAHLAAFLVGKPTEADRKEAEMLLRQVLTDTPDDPFARFQLGRLLLARGDAQGAIPYFQKASEQLGDKELVWYNLSRAYRLAGDVTKERAALARSDALRRDRQELEQMKLTKQEKSHDPSIQLRMAHLYARQGDPIRALYHYRLCLNLQPTNIEANREGAALAARLKDDEVARLKLFRAIVSMTEHAPQNPPT